MEDSSHVKSQALAAAPKNLVAGAADAPLAPLNKWSNTDIIKWRDKLYQEHRHNEEKFHEFFGNLPSIADGSTLASLTLEAFHIYFPKLGIFAPELYAMLQKFKQHGPSQQGGTLTPLPEPAVTPTDEIHPENLKRKLFDELKVELKQELMSAQKRYSPSPSGVPIRQPESLRCVTESVYWGMLKTKEKIKERSLSFVAHVLAPKPPDLCLCYAANRRPEHFKVHVDCLDRCTPCTWDSEAVVQAYWRLQLLPLLLPQMQAARLVDRHARKAIPHTEFSNDLAPDIVLYRDQMPHIDFYILSVGEIKFGKGQEDKITDDHCGQLAKYAQALFDLHPHRQRLFGWVATQSMMRLFKFDVDTNRNIALVETSHDLRYTDGLQQLCTMLRLDLPELGIFAQPIMLGNAFGLVPERYLGRGTFATAYAAKMPDQRTVVIKLFRSDATGAAALNREQKVLEDLRKLNVKGITNLVDSVVYPPASPAVAGFAAAELQFPTVLVLEPEGLTVERVVREACSRLTHEAICKLVDIIRAVHMAGFVHCDLSLGNMYFLPTGNMMVNDFGSAVRLGTTTRKGNAYFMPKAVQETRGEDYIARPAHDLETLVKVLAYGVDTRISNWLSKTAPDDVAARWTNEEKDNPTFRELLVSARESDYDKLKDKLKSYSFI